MGYVRTAVKLGTTAIGGYLGYLLAARRNFELRGKVVVITGGSRGLGLALAEQFLARGARVAICARDGVELDRAADRLRRRSREVLTVVCDITDRNAVDGFISEVAHVFGRIDVVVNNAGTIQVGPYQHMEVEDFRKSLDVMFWGALHTTFAALPYLRRAIGRGGGRVVNITSIGAEVAIPHLLPYTCAKFALRGFSEGLRAELQKERIWVTTVMPGLMRTGSPVNVTFKGKVAKEFAWFALGDALPLTAIGAERAARRIVRACERGESFVTLSWQAKLLRAAHAVAPGLTADLLGIVNGLLPGFTAGGQVRKGRDIDSPVSSVLERYAQRFNEYGGTQAPAEA